MPTHAFLGLLTVYLPRKSSTLQVETVGDCYVAATGLPDPRHDHAVAMMRFAADILAAMRVVTRDLEVILGPDTSGKSLNCLYV